MPRNLRSGGPAAGQVGHAAGAKKRAAAAGAKKKAPVAAAAIKVPTAAETLVNSVLKRVLDILTDEATLSASNAKAAGKALEIVIAGEGKPREFPQSRADREARVEEILESTSSLEGMMAILEALYKIKSNKMSDLAKEEVETEAVVLVGALSTEAQAAVANRLGWPAQRSLIVRTCRERESEIIRNEFGEAARGG